LCPPCFGDFLLEDSARSSPLFSQLFFVIPCVKTVE
jgi:hypothetical protein